MPMKTSKKTKRQKGIEKALSGLVPLSADEIRTRISERKKEEKPVQLPMVLDKRRVTIMEEPDIDWPELWLNVYVHGPEAGPAFTRMFARSKCFKADTPDDADLVVFSGSSHDVNPELYGAKKHRSTFINDAIDKSNLSLYHFCVTRGIPMMGVCGGAQILHVAEGGVLYQDVDGHNGPHTMWVPNEKFLMQRVSSVHHQMCVKNDKMEVLGVSHVSRQRHLDPQFSEAGLNSDVEAFFYPEHCILGFQGHPEYSGYPKYTEWCLKMLDKYLNENPDLGYRGNDSGSNKLRVKLELMEQYAKDKPEITIPSEDMIIVEETKG